LAAAEAQAAVARNEAGYSLSVADADGTVVETLAEPGQVVAAGQVVVRLAHSGAREATVNLPEALRPGSALWRRLRYTAAPQRDIQHVFANFPTQQSPDPYL
jgi:multidrug efflux pump subunit AcrA (membrane-fusion protein)